VQATALYKSKGVPNKGISRSYVPLNKPYTPINGFKGFNGRFEQGYFKSISGLVYREIKPVSFWGT
jgi:hypothetical protein